MLEALRSALAKRAGLMRVVALVGSVAALTLAVPNAADACGITDPLSCVAMIFVKIFQLLTALMGWILVLEVEALVRVAQYHNFVAPGPSAVQIGWVVTRDLANMFFIVVLLIIAFGTIVGSPTYHYEKNLKGLLIMAVVINFSKTICGIFIDMGQVVMLTFVNGFKEAAAGNFIQAFQINKLLALADGQNSYDFGLVIAMMFAFILASIAASVVLVMLVTMIFRIVMLWVLIILSPLAFMMRAVPSGESYYKEWWGEFKKYITTGPILAFFIWIALASVQAAGPGGVAGAGQGFQATTSAAAGEAAGASRISGSQIPTEAGRADTIMNMIVAICLLFAGLKFAQKSGVAGLGVANAIRNRAQKYGRALATGGLKMAAQPLMTGGGKMLARVPLVGGLGRAAVLTGEKWKKDRQAFREKFAGTPEDMARLSPSAYARKVGGLNDPKEIDRFLKAGASNPKAMQALVASGSGAGAMATLIQNGRAADAARYMSSDKRFGDMAKNDPDLMKMAYQGLQDAAKLDPNLNKDVAAFEQKFAAALVKKGDDGTSLMDPDKLKNIVPKMSNDDVMGLGKADMGIFMQHMNSGQLRKLAQDGTPEQQDAMLAALSPDVIGKLSPGDIPASWYGNADVADSVLDRTRNDPKARGEAVAKNGAALQARADKRLEDALTSGDKAAFVAALPDAISVGSLSASRISSDAKLQAAISQNANQIDIQGLGRNVGVGDADRSAAGKALSTLIGDVNPDKLRNARKSGMSEHVLPTVEESNARTAAAKKVEEDKAAGARFEQQTALVEDAASVVQGLIQQHQSMRGTFGAEPPPAAAAEMERLMQSIKSLQGSMEQQKSALKDLGALRDRIGAVNAGREKMAAPQLEALKTAAGNFEKRLESLDKAIAKTVADVKGVKFDTGEAAGRNKGKGNRA